MPSQENIHVENVYAFATAKSQKNGAVFLTLKNNSDIDLHLIEAQSPVAEIVELHENLIDPDTGVMLMRKIRQMEVKAGDKTLLEPTGLHVMLIKLKTPLENGSQFPLTLIFDNNQQWSGQVLVVPPGTTAHNH